MISWAKFDRYMGKVQYRRRFWRAFICLFIGHNDPKDARYIRVCKRCNRQHQIGWF